MGRDEPQADAVTQPSTRVTRLDEKQSTVRATLDELLASTPLATIALVRDGHPVVFPTGFARVAGDLVIHGSTGSPWLRALAAGAPAAPEDPDEDVAGDAWAGVVPMTVGYGAPQAAPDLTPGIAVSASIRAMTERPNR